MVSDAAAAGPAADIETFTRFVGGRTQTVVRNNNPRKTVRVTVRSVCRNPRMNAVASFDVFPKKERQISDDADRPKIRRTVESVAYAPTPGRSKDQ